MPAPRLVKGAPFIKTEGPRVWTTLALTLHADGSAGHELAGASSFPRHWICNEHGKLAGKSALIDFKTWYRAVVLRPRQQRDHPLSARGVPPGRCRALGGPVAARAWRVLS